MDNTAGVVEWIMAVYGETLLKMKPFGSAMLQCSILRFFTNQIITFSMIITITILRSMINRDSNSPKLGV